MAIPRTSIRTGCLIWFVGFGILANLLLIPSNLVSFINGADMLAPAWFKVANLSLLIGGAVCLIAFWRGKAWGMVLYVITTVLYWVAHTLYRGFSWISLGIYLAMTAILLVLVCREQRMPVPPA